MAEAVDTGHTNNENYGILASMGTVRGLEYADNPVMASQVAACCLLLAPCSFPRGSTCPLANSQQLAAAQVENAVLAQCAGGAPAGDGPVLGPEIVDRSGCPPDEDCQDLWTAKFLPAPLYVALASLLLAACCLLLGGVTLA